MNAGIGKNGYKLKKQYPAIAAGIMIGNNANKDYYGNIILKNAKLNIGIDEKSKI